MGGDYDIKEILDWYDFIEGSLDDLIAHKLDDGRISTVEWLQTAASNAPAGLKAVVGSEKVLKQWKNADSEQVKELAGRGLIIAQKIMKLLMSSGPK